MDTMTHVHHWRIESPDGTYSEGHCDCGASKRFRNWLENDGMVNEWLDREQQARTLGPERQASPGRALRVRVRPSASLPPETAAAGANITAAWGAPSPHRARRRRQVGTAQG